MRLTFLGGADEVGASGTLIEIGGKRLLVDAGIRISARKRSGVGDDQLPDLRLISEVGGVDYILVTHAHTDHTGALPLVVERYPHVPVLATEPTMALVRVLQMDAQRIMQKSQEQEGELPLFDQVAVERLLASFQPVALRQTVRLGEGLQVTYHASGHIVGAASLVLESDEGTLVMSGDLSLTLQRAVVRAALPSVKADALVLESTYGGKLHANRAAEEKRLIETLKAVLARGGKALIPAFALGRAQEVIQILLANKEQIDAPIYVDGMVRAVCRAYVRFADWLPPQMVTAAGEEHLFFRGRVKPVETLAQRQEIAQGAGTAVIVSSSGMLTGGPSAYYAQHLAGDARNAILLTGYQDEEAPGRALQIALKQREAGEDVSIKIEGKRMEVRCELGTYSLSAHADEAELVSVAEALDAPEIALVHGDVGARQSLARALRSRGRVVRLPQSGQALLIDTERKPWRVGAVQAGGHAEALDVRALWETLKTQAGSYYSARELALMWSGDGERAAEIGVALAEEGVYFAADWRQKDTFQVRTPEQVARSLKQRAIMKAFPDLIGKCVVLRDSNNRPRVGVVKDVKIDGFEAAVLNAKGRQYPADALVWLIDDWTGAPEGVVLTAQLNERVKVAKSVAEVLLPFEKRRALVEAGQAIDPASLLPELLPQGVTRPVALLAVVLTLAGDGATVEAGGLLPRRAFDGEPVEQNTARQVAFETLPPEARLRKVGMEVHRKRLLLTFDFPEVAAERYAEPIERVSEVTGWDVAVNFQVNQQALGAAVDELLPPGGLVTKGPSYFLDRREIQVEVSGVPDVNALERAYLEMTGYRLRVGGEKGGALSLPDASAPTSDRPPMEINAAYGLIREALEPFGLSKTSLKQGQIVLTFISPQVGARHQAAMTRLADETGYVISIHAHPDQNAILQIAGREARAAGWNIRKGPGLRTDRGEVFITLAAAPNAESLTAVEQAVEAQTGYRLVVT